MNVNIWKGKNKGFTGEIEEQWGIMRDDEFTEFDGKLEMLSDLLQEDGNLQYEAEENYTIFE
ncbi:MAG: general stress protein CsbD [Desulfomicrobium sp.]|nr:general stress protein CsbD [Desulfomicrobium sp.]